MKLNIEFLKSFNIWDGDNIVSSKLNQPLKDMIFNNQLEIGRLYIKNLREYDINGIFQVKINELESKLVKSEALCKREFEGYFQMMLSPYTGGVRNLPDNVDFFSLEQGKYIKYFSNEKVSNFDKDFVDTSNNIKDILKSKNFNALVSKHFPTRVFIMDFCKIHDFHWEYYTVSDRNNTYDVNNCASGASFSRVSFDKLKRFKHIKRAFILPFDDISINYYHNLSECIFGLRYFEYNKYPDVPIIYTQDKFKIIPYLSKKLNIDINRFLSVKDVADCIIEKGVCFYRSGEFWDPTIFEFAKQLIPESIHNITPYKKVYISRLKSARSIGNEEYIEKFLSHKGFEIVYAEELSFEDQVGLFAQTNLLIASHGAGLTNICFMKSGTKMIEIFKKEMIKADYYLRSIHNQMQYQYLILDDNYLNLEDLEVALKKFHCE